MPVYITDTSKFLPNKPVANDEMEEYLGFINGKPSKSKSIVLRNNAITNRYYALEKGGKSTHTNAQMTALAVKELFKNDPEKTCLMVGQPGKNNNAETASLIVVANAILNLDEVVTRN